MQRDNTERGSSGKLDPVAFSERHFILVVFNEANQLLLRRTGPEDQWNFAASGQAAAGETVEDAAARASGNISPPKTVFEVTSDGKDRVSVLFAALETAEEIRDLSVESARASGDSFFSIEEIRKNLAANPAAFDPIVCKVIAGIRPYLAGIPELRRSEQDYIYRFRPEKQRNRNVYTADSRSERLYQSALCRAIKRVKRINERSATTPVALDFGPVSYVVPSHFGFCLGVQNAIERAYECIAENPDRPVYMLSELIHNPFVNDDLLDRGLRCLQSDKGESIRDEKTGAFYWDLLGKDDVVVIPAFGATDEDKARLIEKGIAIERYDATCMLVEKVWKAARRFGSDGFTVIIHGKAEHEETKATFSNAARTGPALIVRDLEEVERLGDVIRENDPRRKRELFAFFVERHTPGFDPLRDLERLAVVNQTTLLRNETIRIINRLEEILVEKHGAGQLQYRLSSNSRGDTLCYATQVNQDALQRALDAGIDLALVAGGRNSSNTYQLFRLCQERLGERAFYIQSEKNILSADRILHSLFEPGKGSNGCGEMQERPFLTRTDRPVRILLTGGASCPDGILQQIIFRVNSFFPAERLRDVTDVLAEI